MRLSSFLVLALSLASLASAQQTTLAPGLTRLSGTESTSSIEYVRILLEGKLILPSSPAPQPPPQLTAQCTRQPSGKLAFELFANFGGIDDNAFYPPWRPKNRYDHPPHIEKPKITLEFIGYTHVKPVKREFEAVLQPSGQYRYNPPGFKSNNLEDSTYYLRFLLALPTLRLTLGTSSSEFATTPLLEQIRKEPLCKAALL